jgi:tRNA1Val (adenine37-N6)-methyltransferase
MPNDYFEFKQFTVWQGGCSQKVSTDACLFGAWTAKHCKPVKHVLDIGAGTGLLMLMMAQKHDVNIDGIEIEKDCAGQMRGNLLSSPWKERLNGIEGDVRAYLFEKKYDLIISNPPFYEKQLQAADTSKNLAWHSSELSFAELFGMASTLLTPEGKFSVIVPYNRKEETLTFGAQSGLLAEIILTVRHTRNHPYTRCMIMFSKIEQALVEKTLDIRNDDGSYSDDFSELLAGYYLFL